MINLLMAIFRPEHWTGKRVLIIGFGNTAADISGVLVGKAEKIYLSHRSGAIVVSGTAKGELSSTFVHENHSSHDGSKANPLTMSEPTANTAS